MVLETDYDNFKNVVARERPDDTEVLARDQDRTIFADFNQPTKLNPIPSHPDGGTKYGFLIRLRA